MAAARLTDEQRARWEALDRQHRRAETAWVQREFGLDREAADLVAADGIQKAARQSAARISVRVCVTSTAKDYLRKHGSRSAASPQQQEAGCDAVFERRKRDKAGPRTPLTRAQCVAEVAKRTGVNMEFRPAGPREVRFRGRTRTLVYREAWWLISRDNPDPCARTLETAIHTYAAQRETQRRKSDDRRYFSKAYAKAARYLAELTHLLDRLADYDHRNASVDGFARLLVAQAVGMGLSRALGDPDWEVPPTPRPTNLSAKGTADLDRYAAEQAHKEALLGRLFERLDWLRDALKGAARYGEALSMAVRTMKGKGGRRRVDPLRAFLATVSAEGADRETLAYMIGVLDPDDLDPTGSGAGVYYLKDLRERVRKNLPPENSDRRP